MHPLLKDRKVLAGLGAGGALALGVVFAMVMAGKSHTPEPAVGNGQLQVEMGLDDAKLDPTKPLRCFVNGQFVGMQTLADCAKRNGIAAQALDVGLDNSGELAAATGNTQLQPLPDVTAAQAQPPLAPPPGLSALAGSVSEASAAGAGGPVGECLRYGSNGWSAAGTGGVALSACVQNLYEGRCVKAGEAVYGRWGSQSLRLVEGRVETSTDNRNFRPLVSQDPRDCSIPPL